MRDGGKNAFTETTGRNRLLEQFTKLIQGFVDSESEEPGSLADKETEADAESSEPGMQITIFIITNVRMKWVAYKL